MSEQSAKYQLSDGDYIRVNSDVRGFIRELEHHYAIIPDSLVLSKNQSAIVLYAVLDRVCDRGRGGYISNKTLTERTGMSRATIYRAKTWLIEHGYIVETFRGKGYKASEFFIPFQTRGSSATQPRFSDDTFNDSPVRQPGPSGSLVTHSRFPGDTLNDSPESTQTEKETETIEHETPGSSAIATEPENKRARPKREKRITEVDQEFRDLMVSEFGSHLGGDGEVNDQIDLAMNHKAAGNYTDLQAYVRNWLKKARSFQPNGGGSNDKARQIRPRGRDDGPAPSVSPFAKYG